MQGELKDYSSYVIWVDSMERRIQNHTKTLKAYKRNKIKKTKPLPTEWDTSKGTSYQPACKQKWSPLTWDDNHNHDSSSKLTCFKYGKPDHIALHCWSALKKDNLNFIEQAKK